MRHVFKKTSIRLVTKILHKYYCRVSNFFQIFIGISPVLLLSSKSDALTYKREYTIDIWYK